MWPFALVGALLAIILGGAVVFVWNQHSSNSTASLQTQAVLPVVARMTPSPRYEPSPFHRAPPTYQNTASDNTRVAAEQRQREQTAREQAALADQMRANDERQRQEAERAAGTDYHVPLDENYVIRVGGSPVSVKVHDNDVTSFDIWLNGRLYREVPKHKGITHSGTDETFLYRNAAASLYYVWEISGVLNHCLLRVRTE